MEILQNKIKTLHAADRKFLRSNKGHAIDDQIRRKLKILVRQLNTITLNQLIIEYKKKLIKH